MHTCIFTHTIPSIRFLLSSRFSGPVGPVGKSGAEGHKGATGPMGMPGLPGQNVYGHEGPQGAPGFPGRCVSVCTQHTGTTRESLIIILEFRVVPYSRSSRKVSFVMCRSVFPDLPECSLFVAVTVDAVFFFRPGSPGVPGVVGEIGDMGPIGQPGR